MIKNPNLDYDYIISLSYCPLCSSSLDTVCDAIWNEHHTANIDCFELFDFSVAFSNKIITFLSYVIIPYKITIDNSIEASTKIYSAISHKTIISISEFILPKYISNNGLQNHLNRLLNLSVYS